MNAFQSQNVIVFFIDDLADPDINFHPLHSHDDVTNVGVQSTLISHLSEVIVNTFLGGMSYPD